MATQNCSNFAPIACSKSRRLRRSLLPAGSHLKLRGYRWAYRRAVPVDLQAVLGRTEIVRSLRTGDLGRAARLADAFDAVVRGCAHPPTRPYLEPDRAGSRHRHRCRCVPLYAAARRDGDVTTRLSYASDRVSLSNFDGRSGRVSRSIRIGSNSRFMFQSYWLLVVLMKDLVHDLPLAIDFEQCEQVREPNASPVVEL